MASSHTFDEEPQEWKDALIRFLEPWFRTRGPEKGVGLTRTLLAVFDGGGSVLTSGVKGDLTIPVDATIIGWVLLANTVGSIQIDVWKDTYANYPPTVADTITASAKPILSTADHAEDSTLTGWNTTINAGDTLRYNIDSVSTISRVTLALTLRT